MIIRKKYNRKWLRLAFALYPIVSIVCFVFPFIPRYVINKLLTGLKGFTGHAGSVTITPFAVHITAKDFYLDIIKPDTKERRIFISAESIMVSLSWIRLWSGTLSGVIKCTAPSFTFSKDDFSGVGMNNPMYGIDIGMDILLEKLEIAGGRFEFVDEATTPTVALLVNNISLTVSNVSTVILPDTGFLSDIILRGDLYEGRLDANMKVNLFSRTPDFSLNAGISDVNMVLLNDFFRAYGKFDIHSGVMGMHSEIESRDGRFRGFVESNIKELQILGPGDNKDSIGKYLLKSLIGVVTELLEDHTTDELSGKINFDESFQNPEIHIGRAVIEVLANAFVHGLTPYLRNEVKIDL
jgi:hypothetical protein